LINIVDRVKSTNTWLSFFDSEYFSSIISLSQSEGYGRLGRDWESALGGLYFSLALPYRHLLPFVMGISVSEILEGYKFSTNLKWPNDIIVGGKKLGGILCQKKDEVVIAGLGINFDNKVSLSTAVSISQLNYKIDKLSFVASFVKKLKSNLTLSDDMIIDKFLRYDILVGEHVTWNEGKGIVETISLDGCLVVKTNEGNLVFLTEEVHLQ
jgi:BirA family biotin operon repressor/biotin-[acetyl-CoA-carboxylase] ligase